MKYESCIAQSERSSGRSPLTPPDGMLVDRIKVLLSQEKSMAYATKDYLKDQHLVANTFEPVNDTCRQKMVEWLYAIIDTCQLRRDVVPIAMSYVDRLLSYPDDDDYAKKILKDRDRYQLVVITCLYIAVKMSEQRVISPEILVQLSRGRYSKQDIEEEEIRILSALGWHLNGPTANDFIQHFLNLGRISAFSEPSLETAVSIARVQAELSVADQSFVSVQYSTIALASIRNAMETIGYYAPREWDKSMRTISTLVDGVHPFSFEVDEVSARLKQMLQESERGTLLPRLSSELVCHTSKQLPKPTLKREISSPTSVSRLAVTRAV